MESKGRISKLNFEVGYGFVAVPKLGNVFFSGQTRIEGATFETLKLDDRVRITVIETERGLFAQTLSVSSPKPRDIAPEVQL